MSRVRDFMGTSKLSICKKGKSEQEEEQNWERKLIENHMILNVGTTGSGKTVLKETRTALFLNNGYTCISMTEKEMNPHENLMMCITPKEEYHLNLLRIQGQEPYSKEKLKGLVKTWHPIFIPNLETEEGQKTYKDVFKKNHFPINWFAFPVRMKEEILMAILSGTADRNTVRISKSVINSLKPHEDLWDMIDKISSEILNKRSDVVYDRNTMGADVGLMGNRGTIETIAGSFSIFDEYYFFQPQDFNLEYDVKGEKKKVLLMNFEGILEILNDNKHIHQLSTAYIEDNRAKYVVILNFLFMMSDAIRRGLVKHPIYLSFDEIMNILPKIGKEEQESFKKILAQTIGKLLRQLRNTGKGVTSDLFTQNYAKTNTEITGSVSRTHLMPLSDDDKKMLIRDFEWTKSRIELLESLQTGECILLQELPNNEGTKFLVAMPPFAVPEEFLDPVVEFSKEYPELMENYGGLYKALVNHKKNVNEKVVGRLKNKQMKRIQEEESKKEDKEEVIRQRVEKEVMSKTEKLSKQEEKTKKKQRCYELRRSTNPDTRQQYQFPEIARIVGISDPSARAYCFEYAQIVKDYDFLRKEEKEYLIPKEGITQ